MNIELIALIMVTAALIMSISYIAWKETADVLRCVLANMGVAMVVGCVPMGVAFAVSTDNNIYGLGMLLLSMFVGGTVAYAALDD